MRVHSDLMQVLVFIIIFIVIHIIIIHHTNRSLNVTLKHKIVLDDGPIIHLKSASKLKVKEAKEKEYEEYNWAVDPVLLREKVLSYPHHLKYAPVEDWPSSMDADERYLSLVGGVHLFHFRWDYFTIECQKKNISDINEVKHCALDSGIFIMYCIFIMCIEKIQWGANTFHVQNVSQASHCSWEVDFCRIAMSTILTSKTSFL